MADLEPTPAQRPTPAAPVRPPPFALQPAAGGRPGTFNFEQRGGRRHALNDLYHSMLVIPWSRFFGVLTLAYIVGNAIFGAGYLACGDCIGATDPTSFLQAFSFSVQTMSSVGYGAMAPRTPMAFVLSDIEAFVGMLGMAIATGLLFSRFSKPSAKVTFSDRALVVTRDGERYLSFRLANERGNRIVEARIQVVLLFDEVSAEGQHLRRLVDLTLERSQNPVFAMTWTVLHRIDERSPFRHVSPENIQDRMVSLLVSLTGTDDTFNQSVTAQHFYVPADVRWGARFGDMLGTGESGRMVVHLDRIHDVILSDGTMDRPSTERP